MTRKEITSLIILILVIGFGAYKYYNRSFTEVKSQYMLDTVVEISATSSSKQVGRQIDSVFTYIGRLEDKLNEYKDDSWLGRINTDSVNTVFAMDDDAYNILVIADSLYRLSEGSFDPSIKPVWDLWGFNTESPTPPDSLEIKKELGKVGFGEISFDRKELRKPRGMQLTFGAIAKGYILDKARDYMQTMHLESGYINCRSSMTFFGNRIPQIVYIQHPRKTDDHIASFKLQNLSVGTSGDYQQFYEIEGVRYHHIINPSTGYPVPDVHSVTVTCASAAWADGLSTALFLVPPEKGLEIIKRLPDTNVVIYYSNESGLVSLKSNGMKDLDLSEKL
ncbi:FAD:protein FMN transferase [Candidatus Cloacimonadaceae bacterium]